MLRILLLAFTLIFMTLPAAHASQHDRNRAALGAGIGAAVGAAIGSEIGGRNEAIIGGAIGGALGVAIATDDRRLQPYREHRQVRPYDSRGHRHRGPRHCPPGLAKQGRC